MQLLTTNTKTQTMSENQKTEKDKTIVSMHTTVSDKLLTFQDGTNIFIEGYVSSETGFRGY